MSHHSHQPAADFSYFAVLLLLAYVLSSAPRYVRDFRQFHHEINIEKASPLQKVLKAGRFYTIDPYIRVWNRISSGRSANELAAFVTPVSR